MIWEYRDIRDANQLAFVPNICMFCMTPLTLLAKGGGNNPRFDHDPLINSKDLKVCESCGWWTINYEVYQESWNGFGIDWSLKHHLGYASLRKLDIESSGIAIDTLRQYLIPKFENRFRIDPRKLEEIVEDVFKDFGFRTKLTPYTKDDGIDIFLLGDNRERTIGIQVKRNKQKIEVHEIREFTGTLWLGGLTKGVFITTSEFTKGAINTARKSTLKGIEIELMDADSLFSSLDIANRDKYNYMTEPGTPFIDYVFDIKEVPCIKSESGYHE